MIPTNKLKKLVLECIVKFMDNSFQNIWDDCSKEILVRLALINMDLLIIYTYTIFQETTEMQINPLEIKELFFKEILPDLNYINFGYDNETVEKLKNFSKKIIINPLHFDSNGENITEKDIDNDGTSSIDWIEVDKVLAESVENKTENLAELPEEQIMSTDDEYEGDDSVNAILAKYSISGHVRASQETFLSQPSEQMYCFRESQLINIFDSAENDPLENNISNTENPIESDAHDYLSDGGKLPNVASEFLDSAETFKCSETPSNSILFDNTEHRRKSLKRKSSSLTNINLAIDNDFIEFSKPKRRFSDSLQDKEFSLMSESSKIELASITQRINDLQATNKELEAEKESKEITNPTSFHNANDSKIVENSNNEAKKSTDEIVAEIQKQLFAATNNEEIQRILDEHNEYLLMLEIPFIMPPDSSNNISENKEEEKSDSSKSAKESQNVKSTQQPQVSKFVGKKIARDLKYCRPKLSYDITQCSDTINSEETSNWLTMNDTVLSGSHKDCIGTVQDLDYIPLSQSSNFRTSQLPTSRSQSHSNSHPQLPENVLTDQATEIIKKIQKQLNVAESAEEIDRILDENDKYRIYVRIPFLIPLDQNSPEETEKSPEKILSKEKINPEKSKEEIIADIQKQLDAAETAEEIDRILDENDKYRFYVRIPFLIPLDDISQNSPEKTENSREKNLSKEKSKEEIIADIQKQLDAARDPDVINEILRKNNEYLLFLTIPFILPPDIDFDYNEEKAQLADDKLTSKNSISKVKQETQKKRKQALQVKVENNLSETQTLERNASRTELSFLLGENVNLKHKEASSAPKPKSIDENVIIDLIDDDDDDD